MKKSAILNKASDEEKTRKKLQHKYKASIN